MNSNCKLSAAVECNISQLVEKNILTPICGEIVFNQTKDIWWDVRKNTYIPTYKNNIPLKNKVDPKSYKYEFRK